MNQQKRNILIRILIAAIMLILLSCDNSKKTVETAFSGSDSGKIPDNQIWDMDVNITNEGKLKAKFKAGYVERENIANSRYSISHVDSGLVIDFFENDIKTGVLISKKGDINDLTELFIAIEDVVFNSNKGYVLYTDTLEWDRKTAKIYTDCDVMIIKDMKDTLYGKGFITDDKFQAYEIKKPKGRTMIEEKNAIK